MFSIRDGIEIFIELNITEKNYIEKYVELNFIVKWMNESYFESIFGYRPPLA